MALLIAASMTAILSRFSVPDILAGRTIVFTATVLPRQRPAQTQTNPSTLLLFSKMSALLHICHAPLLLS